MPPPPPSKNVNSENVLMRCLCTVLVDCCRLPLGFTAHVSAASYLYKSITTLPDGAKRANYIIVTGLRPAANKELYWHPVPVGFELELVVELILLYRRRVKYQKFKKQWLCQLIATKLLCMIFITFCTYRISLS